MLWEFIIRNSASIGRYRKLLKHAWIFNEQTWTTFETFELLFVQFVQLFVKLKAKGPNLLMKHLLLPSLHENSAYGFNIIDRNKGACQIRWEKGLPFCLIKVVSVTISIF